MSGLRFIDLVRAGGLPNFYEGQLPPNYERQCLADLGRARVVLADDLHTVLIVNSPILFGNTHDWDLRLDEPTWFEMNIPELGPDAHLAWFLRSIESESPESRTFGIHVFDSTAKLETPKGALFVGPKASAYVTTDRSGHFESLSTNFLHGVLRGEDPNHFFVPGLLALHLLNRQKREAHDHGEGYLVLAASGALVNAAIQRRPPVETFAHHC